MLRILPLLFILLNPASSFAAAIATGHELATKTAADVLKAGGNAVDATIAASFMLNVVQPYKMGIGGGGLLLVQKDGKVFYWDHREEAPASTTEKLLIGTDGKALAREDAITGPNPVGIPGTPAGLFAAHKKLGHLPWKKLLEPAISAAREGVPITERFEGELEDNWKRISQFPLTATIFGDGEGGYMKRGRVLKQPMLAKTLEALSANGADAFYSGALAKSWTDAAAKEGVRITLVDLKKYKIHSPEPVRFKVFGLDAAAAPPPSTASVSVAGPLRAIEEYWKRWRASHKDAVLPSADSAHRIIVTIEAMRFFQALRDDTVADPPFAKIDPQKWIGSDEERKAWATIFTEIRKRLDKIETLTAMRGDSKLFAANDVHESGMAHTDHLSIVDDHGMAVAYTSTIEALFGSGITVPGHGFLLNNELADFDADVGKPNSPAPGKRPRSNMSPVIFSANVGGKSIPVAIAGAAGGPRIPTSVVEILENYYLHGMSAREAIAFPRAHLKKDKLEIEKAIGPKTMADLKQAGYELAPIERFASTAEVILRRSPKAKWEAASEPRYDGLGIEF